MLHVRIEVEGDKKPEYLWDLNEQRVRAAFVQPWLEHAVLLVNGRRLTAASIRRLQVFTSSGTRADLETMWNARADHAATMGILTFKNDGELWLKFAKDVTEQFLEPPGEARVASKTVDPSTQVKPQRAAKAPKPPKPATLAPAPSSRPRRKVALLIAVENYQSKKISPVGYAAADADELGATLKVHGFECSIYKNQAATKSALESHIKKAITSLGKDDTFFLFYAGHGFSDRGKNYLTCYDSLPNDGINTSLRLQLIFNQLKKSPCEKKAMFLDACQTGWVLDESMRSLLSGMSESELEKFFDGAEYCVGFAACKLDESSWSASDLKHGIWTYFLIRALRGEEPDAVARDGLITDSSLLNYLAARVPIEVAKRHPNEQQTPRQFGSRGQEFLIVDVNSLAKRQTAPSALREEALDRITLLSETTGQISRLGGFKKGVHSVPSAITGKTQQFVRSIANDTITEEISAVRKTVKEAFGYKSSELAIHDETSGLRALDTPDFFYGVEVFQHDQDANKFIRVESLSFRRPEASSTPVVDGTFGVSFRTVEWRYHEDVDVSVIVDKLEDLGLEVDDSTPNVCVVTMDEPQCCLVVKPGGLHVRFAAGKRPSELLTAFKDLLQGLEQNGLAFLLGPAAPNSPTSKLVRTPKLGNRVAILPQPVQPPARGEVAPQAFRWSVQPLGAAYHTTESHARRLLKREAPMTIFRMVDVYPASIPDQIIAPIDLRRTVEAIAIMQGRSPTFPFHYSESKSKALLTGFVWERAAVVRQQFSVGLDGSFALREELWEEKYPTAPPFRIGSEVGGSYTVETAVKALLFAQRLRDSVSRKSERYRLSIVLDGMEGKRLYCESPEPTSMVSPILPNRTCHEKIVEVSATFVPDLAVAEILAMVKELVQQVAGIFDAPAMPEPIMLQARKTLGL